MIVAETERNGGYMLYSMQQTNGAKPLLETKGGEINVMADLTHPGR